MIALEDRGLLLGDGVFETVLALDGELVWWGDHMDRMGRGCEALGLPVPDPETALAAAQVALEDAGLAKGRAAVRVTWTAGSGGRGLDRPETLRPRLFVNATPSAKPADPVRLATVAVRRNEGSPASHHKTLAYLDNVLARRAARSAGAGEAVMLNNRGEVAGCAAANLFWRTEDGWRTPALDCGVLPGLARQRVLALAAERGLDVAQVREGATSLAQAQAAFITNSLIGLRVAAVLDGRALAVDVAVTALARLLP